MRSSAPISPQDDIAGRITPVDREVRRVLMLTHRVPFPPDRGDRIRSYHLLRELSRHFEVSLASMSDEPVTDDQRAALQDLTAQFHVQRISSQASKFRAAVALMRDRAGTPRAFFRRALAKRIERWHHEQPFDAVLTFCTGMNEYARLLCSFKGIEDQPRHILDLVDVDSLKWRAYAGQSRGIRSTLYAREAKRLAEIEAGKHDLFNAITVISDAEADAYRFNISDSQNLYVIRNGVDLHYFHPLDDAMTSTIAFVGVLDYPPNIEAMEWFVTHALPLLQQRCGNVRLQIAGRHPSRRIMQLDGQANVSVLGPVDDIRDVLRRAAVVVAPLQTARGVQNKVLEAMACQRAVVVSPQALEGIHATPGEHLVLAESPQQWADYTYRLLEEADVRQSIAAAARRQVEQYYDWPTAIAPMIDLIRGKQPEALRAAG